VPNIPIGTEMSPPLYGIVQIFAYPVIDQYWNTSIADVLNLNFQPNMYGVMLRLYLGAQELPVALGRPSKRELSHVFCQLWLRPPPFAAGAAEPPEAIVKREAVIAVGSIYYDVVHIAYNGAEDNTRANGAPTFDYAVEVWTQKNGFDLQREQTNLTAWLQSQPN
jgi:hypothetical protein